MKLKLVLGMLVLVTTISNHAQNIIRNHSKWFDGSVLYTANIHNGMILLGGSSELNKKCVFMLEAVEGGYVLSRAFEDEQLPIRGQNGCKVEYIREDGMYFLAVKNEENETVWTLTLTPDNLENCLGQEKFAEEQPVEEMLSGYLMNTTYLSRFSKLELKGMEAMLNDKRAKSIIERTNLSLIRSEMKVPESERELLRKTKEEMMVEVNEGTTYVTNEREFLDALANGANIVLKEGTSLNLSNILYDMEYFDTDSRRFMEDASNIHNVPTTQLVSESVFNGRQLTIINLRDVTIRGERNAAILVEPLYAYVLNFVNCHNITLENLTLGHVEEGFCTGGVVGLTACAEVKINQCDMFGCGAYGIIAEKTDKLYVSQSIIRDCSYGIMEIRGGDVIKFDQCDFIRNKEYTMVYIDESATDVSFYNCRFAQNKGVLFELGTKIQMENCEIHHADETTFGTENMIEYLGRRNRIFIDDNPLPERNVGPDCRN